MGLEAPGRKEPQKKALSNLPTKGRKAPVA